MPAGPLPPNPAELLMGSKMVSLLAVAAEKFDMLIMDGPPIMGLADALILSNLAQGTLVVVHAEKTRIAVIKHALKRLRDARAHIVGGLLTHFQPQHAGQAYGVGGYAYYSQDVGLRRLSQEMSPAAAPALRQALELVRAPRGARPGPDELLPDGMLMLLRIVAGEGKALELARESTGETVEVLREAAAFYIQQVMFATDSHSYRVLGVDVDSADDRIREHYRWLATMASPRSECRCVGGRLRRSGKQRLATAAHSGATLAVRPASTRNRRIDNGTRSCADGAGPPRTAD